MCIVVEHNSVQTHSCSSALQLKKAFQGLYSLYSVIARLVETRGVELELWARLKIYVL